jgi:hypothetical protein
LLAVMSSAEEDLMTALMGLHNNGEDERRGSAL